MPRRLIAALLATSMGIAACSGGEVTPGDVTTTEGTGGTTTLPPTTTTTEPLPDFADAAEATAFLYGFDPVSGNPDALRLALDAIPGGHFQGSPIPALLVTATPDLARVILDDLARPSAPNVHILTAMERYGTPGGSIADPDPWPAPIRIGISAALQKAAAAYFGPLDDVAVGFIERLLDTEIDGCEGACPWAGAWYDVPRWVEEVRGTVTGESFQGRVGITDAGGSVRFEDVSMEFIIGVWVVTAGYLAEADAPVFAITGPLDGVYVTDAIVAISGLAEPGTTVSVGTDSFTVDDFQFWDLVVTVSPGRNEFAITATNTAGKTATQTITVFYVPDAVTVFGYVVGADATTITVDEADLLFGDEANAAARADGVIGEDEVLEDGYYLMNPDPATTVYPVDPGIRVIVVDVGVVYSLVPYADLRGFVAGRVETGSEWLGGNPILSPFTLLIVDGRAVQVEQQYLP